MGNESDLIHATAAEVVGALTEGELTPHQVLDAAEARIEAVDGMVNALPTRCFDRAREHADRLMTRPPAERGVLAGLPVPIKDLNNVAGVRITYGSRLRSDHVPETSSSLVTRIESNGGVVNAISNSPEFGAGGNTFNDVFGPTRNPHDLRLTAGGSSGGAAAAIASGSAWVAQGSDLGGSLRTPAAFCGITSLRPSPGLIPTAPSATPFFVHPQQGPMARSIEDLALFADAMAGADPLAGVSKPRAPRSFREAAANPTRPVKVAVSPDLGIAELDQEIAAVFSSAVDTIASDGITINHDHPDLSGAPLAFSVARGLMYSALLGDELEAARDVVKPEVLWNLEHGLALSGDDVRASVKAQAQAFANAAAFMSDYDVLICPATVVPPFPVEERYPGYGAGLGYDRYLDWLAIVAVISATTLPVITIPCGTTTAGLPAAVQIVGRPHGELALFEHAACLEGVLGHEFTVTDPQPISNP